MSVRLRAILYWSIVAGCPLVGGACGSEGDTEGSSSTETGGNQPFGGGPSAGGNTATGGDFATGGYGATGGEVTTGGTGATGGQIAAGGAPAGGTESGGMSAGGAVAAGGDLGSGGIGVGGTGTGGDLGSGGTGTGGDLGSGGLGTGGGLGVGGNGTGSDVGTGGTVGESGGTAGTGGAGTSGDGGASGDAGSGGSATGGTTAEDATIVPDPSWACGVPEGVPPPTQGDLVFHATLELGDVYDVGTTQYGDRRLLGVTGGTFTGDRVQGTLLTGGLDLELTLSNGSVELEDIEILRTSDGTPIYLRSCGFAPAGDPVVRVVPDFEVATSSSYAWLNDGQFAGTLAVDEAAGTIEFDVYDVSGLAPAEPFIQLEDPAGVPNQPWECSTETGAQGATVFTETVTLGSSISIGASKRGTRNIIPITGGTVSGRVTGSVLPGGGDYQLIGSVALLDARYALSTHDGEFVLVRNCGPMGALVPLFETRADGPYAFLNANTCVSSDPGGAAGGVSITFYERQ